MPQVTDGMPATPQGEIRWTKSSHSNPYGNCVAMAELAGGKIAIRNSQYLSGPVLFPPRVAMAAFVQAVKEGEFDEIAGGISLGLGCGRAHRGFGRPGCRLWWDPSVVL
ncbi:MAG: DUF397 domain-containing protein [Pseudonocardiaceae bacterium]